MTSTPLVLAPPGAGLPRVELWIVRTVFAVYAGRGLRGLRRDFNRERMRLAGAIADLTEEAGSRRVVIRRLPGMEDSSRDWSVWLTLEHLRLVQTGVAGIIGELRQGRLPPGQVQTAAVKPASEANRPAAREGFEESCARLERSIESAPAGHLRSRPWYPHPWFGPLSAHAWFAMAGFHLQLHRRQIEQILQHPRP